MNGKIKLRTAVFTVGAIIAVILMVMVYPLQWIGRPHISKSLETPVDTGVLINKENEVTQLMGTEGDKLCSVTVLINEATIGSPIELVLYDGERNLLLRRTVTVTDSDLKKGKLTFKLDYLVEKGASYFIQFRVPDIEDWRPQEELDRNQNSNVVLSLEDHALTTATANSYIAVNGIENEEYNLIQRYRYRINFSAIQRYIIWLIICLMEFFAFFISKKIFDLEKEVKVQQVVTAICNPLICILTLIALIYVWPLKTFGNKWFNILFWNMGIIMTGLFCLFVVNYKRSGHNKFLPSVDVGAIVRIIALCEIFWQGFKYINGLYNIHHSYAYRGMLLWLLVFVIGTMCKKELWNRWVVIFNAIWITIGTYVGINRLKTLPEKEEELVTFRLEAFIIVLAGIAIINLIYCIVRIIINKDYRKNCPGPDWWVVLPLGIFLTGFMLLRNTREWPPYLLTIVLIVIVRLFFWTERNKFDDNVISGVILTFIKMVIYSLLHRPYYYYRLHRYSLGFHTVTMTATYMTLILGAIGVRLIKKSARVKNKRDLWPEFALFGIAANYMMFTLSRTGYFSVIIMVLITLFVLGIFYDKSGTGYKNTVVRIAVMASSLLLMFPITFTATRIVPAVADDPIVYDFEHMDITMYRGTPKDSETYMDIYRFGQVFGSKILGVGDTVTLLPGQKTEILADKAVNLRGNYNKSAFQDNGLLLTGTRKSLGILNSANPLLEEDSINEFSNGRISIFKSYISQSNMWGHDEMGAILENGEEATHAHNTFLQAVYDHGWVFGIYFTVFLIYIWILALKKRKLSLVVILAGLCSAGLVEWVFHPCYPISTAVLFLMCDMIWNKAGNEVQPRKSAEA